MKKENNFSSPRKQGLLSGLLGNLAVHEYFNAVDKYEDRIRSKSSLALQVSKNLSRCNIQGKARYRHKADTDSNVRAETWRKDKSTI